MPTLGSGVRSATLTAHGSHRRIASFQTLGPEGRCATLGAQGSEGRYGYWKAEIPVMASPKTRVCISLVPS